MAYHPQLKYDTPRSEINMIPLIDVMLVLLIIFIIAAPLLTHAVKIDLPVADSATVNMKPETIQLGIKADGQFLWNGESVEETELEAMMQEAASREPLPELHLQADATTPYEFVARTMARASRAGLEKIGFVSKPDGQTQTQ
ncbi:MAG: biopolymer transporter ExbD [Burkholderiales bacterium]|jgi:biopolymer transport protein ExbD|nr:biopolymer transporter ExbD [Burkholderiales bacterium]